MLCIAKPPLTAKFEMVSAAAPVLVTVRVCGALVTPTACVVLKAMLVGERLTTGAVPAVPLKSAT